MAVRKRNNRWYVDFRFNGKRIRKASPENTKSSALAYERQLWDELEKGNTKKNARCRSYKDFASDWMETYVMANNRPSEQRKKRQHLNNHILPHFGHLRLNEIGAREIVEFKKDKVTSGISLKTIKNIFSVLRKSLHTAVMWEELDRVPYFEPIRHPTKEIQVVSKQNEELLLYDNSDLFWNTMIVVSLQTGMRLGEKLALRWMDIDFDENVIVVNGSIDVLYNRAPTKNGKFRIVPMSDMVQTKLKELLSQKTKDKSVEKGAYVFDRGDGRPVHPNVALKNLKRLSKRLGITELIWWHKFRHTFATNLMKRGVHPQIAQKILGHSSIETTMKYSHVDTQSKQSAIQLFNNRNENDGHMSVQFPNHLVKQKAKHSHNMTVLS